MKKSRPAHQLSLLCAPADQARMEAMLFTETPTLGIRRHTCSRRTLERTSQTVETPFGSIRVKVALLKGKPVTIKPEFEDCLAAARAHHVSVRDVQHAARAAYAHVQFNTDTPH